MFRAASLEPAQDGLLAMHDFIMGERQKIAFITGILEGECQKVPEGTPVIGISEVRQYSGSDRHACCV